jgi:hypothetical protein
MASIHVRRACGVWGAVCIIFQIVRTAGWESYFRHFTAWVWTLQAIFFFVVWAAKPASVASDINTTFVLPLVFSMVWFVFIAISFMAPWDVDLVRDSIDDYGEATVGGVNFLLHYTPWLALGLYVLLDETVIKQRTRALLDMYRANSKIDTFVLMSMTLPLCFTLSYFFWFDAVHEYGIHGVAEWIVVLLSAGIVLVVTALYWAWFWPSRILPHTRPVKTQ